MRILHAADLHGNVAHYRELLSVAVTQKADCLVIGGDLFPGEKSLNLIFNAQKQFLTDYLKPLLEQFREANPEKTTYLMMGNDDLAVNMGYLEDMEAEGILKLLHMRIHAVSENLFIAGYGCVPPTAFMMKDWERLDADRSMVPDRSYQACSSGPNGIEVVDAREWFLSHDTIEEELEKLAQLSKPVHTIYVTHSPPCDTKLDVTQKGRHVGSMSLRKFIEKHKPPLTLHGHIHESHRVTNEIKDCVGDTVCINPGQSDRIFHAVIIDIVENKTRRIVSYPGEKELI